jgi:Zn-dependent M28 family amino/carboxypeptidase
MPGDNIFNGADDNATGCGILPEGLGRSDGGQRPRRSIIFAAVTAENKGCSARVSGKTPPIPRKDCAGLEL